MSRKKKVSAAEAQSYLDNAISTLVANIRFAAVDTDIRTICITSSIPNEGKSTVAVGLAEALAKQGRRVLIIENDLHRRSLAGLLGAHARSGLYGVLVGQASLEEAAIPTRTEGLFFLDCEPQIPNPANVLSSRRYKSLVATAREMYDYVVFDTPPVSTFVDGAVVGSLADATLLVVRRDHAKRDEVAGSLEQLRKADANVIGTVFNFVETDRSEYYYEYYTKGGKKVRSRKGGSDGPRLQTSAATATATSEPAVARTARPAQGQQAASAGVAPVQAAGSARKVSPDSTEAFMVNAGYVRGNGNNS